MPGAPLRAVVAVGLLLLAAWSFAALPESTAPRSAGPMAAAYTVRGPITITSNAGFTSANGVTGGSGTAADPYVISGWEIDNYSGSPSITLAGTTAHVVLTNDLVTNTGGASVCGGTLIANAHNVTFDAFASWDCQPAVSIEGSVDVTVNGSSLSSTNWASVLVQSSSRIRITSNWDRFGYWAVNADTVRGLTVTGNAFGNMGLAAVYLTACPDAVIANNTIWNGAMAIEATGSNRTLIEGNAISNNIGGLRIESSSNVTIEGNNVSQTFFDAVDVDGSSNFSFTGNNLSMNSGGLNLTGGSFGVIDRNWFVDNAQQYWDSLDRPWDVGYPGGGNWWSDYDGVDHCRGPSQNDCTSGDGIGDTPYVVGGVVRDRYPLMPPNLPISVVASASPQAVLTHVDVQFSCAIVDREGNVTSVAWAFGDGTGGTGMAPVHAYASPGVYEAVVTVTDNRSMAARANVTIAVTADVTPPSVSAAAVGPHFVAGWFTGEANLTIDATDTQSGVGVILYRVDSGGWQNYTGPVPFLDGSWYVNYTAVDRAGNEASFRTIVVRVDSTPPVLQLDPLPATVGSSAVTVSWAGHDPTSGIARYEVSVDGGTAESVELNMSFTTSLADGPHTILVTAVDNAGNRATKSVAFTVDTNPFSPSGPYLGVPTYALIGAAIAVAGFVLWRRRIRSRRPPAAPPEPGEPPRVL